MMTSYSTMQIWRNVLSGVVLETRLQPQLRREIPDATEQLRNPLDNSRGHGTY